MTLIHRQTSREGVVADSSVLRDVMVRLPTEYVE